MPVAAVAIDDPAICVTLLDQGAPPCCTVQVPLCVARILESLETVTRGIPVPDAPVPVASAFPPNCVMFCVHGPLACVTAPIVADPAGSAPITLTPTLPELSVLIACALVPSDPCTTSPLLGMAEPAVPTVLLSPSVFV